MSSLAKQILENLKVNSLMGDLEALACELMYEDEVLDDLQLDSLMLIQKSSCFKFGIDAVLLSHIVKAKPDDVVFDLCTGSGVIPILLSSKIVFKKLVGIELDFDMVDMARRSVKLNSLENKLEVIEFDIKNIPDSTAFKPSSVNVICANPPYFKRGAAILNEDVKKLMARHEIYLSLEDLFRSVSYLLVDRGNFYMIHRPDRLVDIFEMSRKYRLEPKWMQLVYPKRERPANLVLLKFVKNANPELRLAADLYVYDENGKYSKEIDEIYNRRGL